MSTYVYRGAHFALFLNKENDNVAVAVDALIPTVLNSGMTEPHKQYPWKQAMVSTMCICHMRLVSCFRESQY